MQDVSYLIVTMISRLHVRCYTAAIPLHVAYLSTVDTHSRPILSIQGRVCKPDLNKTVGIHIEAPV
jgi:hypothetical protein